MVAQRKVLILSASEADNPFAHFASEPSGADRVAVSRVVRRTLVAYPDARASERGFLAVSTLLFVASVAATIAWNAGMSAMWPMPLCGGHALWTMSMRMPGESWPGAAAGFLGMWEVMMAAMMLPSLVPMLRRYRQAAGGTSEMHMAWLTMLAGLGYFGVWALCGMAAFELGAAVTTLEMQLPAVAQAAPMAVGAVVLGAGAIQFTPWKAQQLACCRAMPRSCRILAADVGTAWGEGLRLGLNCGRCCGNLMAILLVIGVMDLRAMAAVTAAITAERLARDGTRVARLSGAVAIAAGLLLMAQAAGLG